MTKTLDDIKREVYEHYDALHITPEKMRAGCMSMIMDAIDHLHSQGLMMVWNTDMDSAPRDELILVKAHYDGVHYFTAYRGKDNMFYQPRQIYDNLPDMYIIEPTAWMPLPKTEVGE